MPRPPSSRSRLPTGRRSRRGRTRRDLPENSECDRNSVPKSFPPSVGALRLFHYCLRLMLEKPNLKFFVKGQKMCSFVKGLEFLSRPAGSYGGLFRTAVPDSRRGSKDRSQTRGGHENTMH